MPILIFSPVYLFMRHPLVVPVVVHTSKYKFSLHEFGMLLSPIIAEELAQPYCPSKCRPLQLEWKTGIPKFHLEIMAFNLHNVSWWVYCLYPYSLFVLFIFFIYSLLILNLSFDSL